MQFLIPVTMEYKLKVKKETNIKTVMVAALAVVVAVTAVIGLAAPAAMQVIPSAYAATATGGSAITEGACSTGTFADNILASVASSCGPNLSKSAAGDVALCIDDGSISIGIEGACSTSN
jgi:hypothetical protein